MTRRVDEAAARAAFARALAGEREVFGDFFLSRSLGLEITQTAEACIVSFEVADFLYNPQGTLHGGIMATALDIAMGHRLHHLLGAGTTLESKFQYLGAIRQGRSICFLRAEARDPAGALLAFATSTWKLLAKA